MSVCVYIYDTSLQGGGDGGCLCGEHDSDLGGGCIYVWCSSSRGELDKPCTYVRAEGLHPGFTHIHTYISYAVHSSLRQTVVHTTCST